MVHLPELPSSTFISTSTMVNELNVDGPSQTMSPSPPRWRFIKEAKSTSGYSSLSAGISVPGLSSEELAVKYEPPSEADQPKKKAAEHRDVRKLDTIELESAFKHRMIVNAIDDSTAASVNVVNEGDLYIGDIEGGCSGDANAPELETKPTEATDAEDAFADIPLEDAEAKTSNGESPDKDERSTSKDQICVFTKKQNACLLLLLLSLVVIATTLGLSLGKNGADHRKETQTTEMTVRSTIPTSSPSTFPTLLIQSEVSAVKFDTTQDYCFACQDNSQHNYLHMLILEH